MAEVARARASVRRVLLDDLPPIGVKTTPAGRCKWHRRQMDFAQGPYARTLPSAVATILGLAGAVSAVSRLTGDGSCVLRDSLDASAAPQRLTNKRPDAEDVQQDVERSVEDLQQAGRKQREARAVAKGRIKCGCAGRGQGGEPRDIDEIAEPPGIPYQGSQHGTRHAPVEHEGDDRRENSGYAVSPTSRPGERHRDDPGQTEREHEEAHEAANLRTG